MEEVHGYALAAGQYKKERRTKMGKGNKFISLLAVLVVLSLGAVALPQGEVLAQPPEYWAKTYGGSSGDWAYSVQQTSDGGYIVAGHTESFGAGGTDFWVLKLASNGSVDWQKTYGRTEDDFARSIQQTSDGGYIVAGDTGSFGAEVSDFWVLKLASNGNVDWQKTYGGSDGDEVWSVQQTSDGGYIVAGQTWSFGAGSSDFWVLKLASNGNVDWQKTYGDSDGDAAYSVQQTSDGGYIVAGHTELFGDGFSDFWVLKLASNGSVDWQKTYGGSDGDRAWSVQQTSDGGYIVAGFTDSFGAGSSDFWVLKLTSNGNVDWQKTYGGTEDDFARSIQQTSDGGYIVAGDTESFGAAGDNDFWVLKLASDGSVDWQKTYGGSGGDIAYPVQQTADGGYIVAGNTRSFGAGSSDFWVLRLDESGSIPECPLGVDSDASVTTPELTIGDDEPDVYETEAEIGTPNYVLKDTNCSTDTQCYYTPLFDPWDYDVDEDGVISKMEALTAVVDYFGGLITKQQALAVIVLYFD